MMKILIASPIKQKANILREFLISLEELDKENIDVHYYFVDDANDEDTVKLLKTFEKNNANVILKNNKDFNINANMEYLRNDNTHTWKKELIHRIIVFKNDMIKYAKDNDFDYIFFIDSDIVLNPITLKHLISRNVDIVSNVFWTKFTSNSEYQPQVWLQDKSNYFYADWDKPITMEEMHQAEKDFVNMLKIPGIYEVGGLGACTLISKKAIKKGVSFSLLKNVSFWGEDRHFCIRAVALGFKLYVDTVYPAYHIYRESYLSGVNDYKKHGFIPNDIVTQDSIMVKIKSKLSKFNIFNNISIPSLKRKVKYYLKRIYRTNFSKKRIINKNNNITVSMVVHNEANRYLERVLLAAKKYASNFVIIDDASTDNTVEICEEVLKDVKHKIIKNKVSLFKNEYKLRMLQWNETLKENPDWIMFLDADEEFEEEFNLKYKYLIENKDVDAYSFRLCDMWNEEEYREDSLWNPNVYRPFLIRYQPKFHYKFLKQAQHCGRLPYNALRLQNINSTYRVKHYGWMNPDDRKQKYERYKKLDPEGKYGVQAQYESILDENPNLVKFIEKENIKDEN